MAAVDQLLEALAGHVDHGSIVAGAATFCGAVGASPMLDRSPTAVVPDGLFEGGWPPSSSGLGPRPFTAVARVRIPLGVRLDSEARRWMG